MVYPTWLSVRPSCLLNKLICVSAVISCKYFRPLALLCCQFSRSARLLLLLGRQRFCWGYQNWRKLGELKNWERERETALMSPPSAPKLIRKCVCVALVLSLSWLLLSPYYITSRPRRSSAIYVRVYACVSPKLSWYLCAYVICFLLLLPAHCTPFSFSFPFVRPSPYSFWFWFSFLSSSLSLSLSLS